MSDPVTLAVTDHVPMEAKARYEALVEELHKLLCYALGVILIATQHQCAVYGVYICLKRISGL
jgi:hypothetical protein